MSGPVNAPRLKSIVERIERIEEERKALGGDLKDIYSEAKGVGYDVKTLRKVIAARRMDAADREEAENLYELYMDALGHQVAAAVRAVQAGEKSTRKAADDAGISKSRLHRSVPKEGMTPNLGTVPEESGRPVEEIAADILALPIEERVATIMVVDALAKAPAVAAIVAGADPWDDAMAAKERLDAMKREKGFAA